MLQKFTAKHLITSQEQKEQQQKVVAKKLGYNNVADIKKGISGVFSFKWTDANRCFLYEITQWQK